MNSKKIQLLLTGVAAWISLLLMITTTYSASIVIGGDYTDIGTIVIVSPKPGDTPQANGTALLNNLAAITADVNNRYLIKLGPGIYDIGTNSLHMKAYVGMEGSGQNVTVITGAMSYGSFPPTNGVVNGANNAEIRFLTVKNTGIGSFLAAILNSSASPAMTNVTATASGGTFSFGVFNYSSSPMMTNVTASASGNTENIGVYNYSSSPTMTNVTASAWGNTENIGVYNYRSSPTMTNVTATASGGTDSCGVFNSVSSSPTMTNVTATASGGTSNYGVYNSGSSPTMTNVTASGSGGTNNYGVSSDTSGTIQINHSVIKGSTNTIVNGSEVTTHVGNTQLDGGPVSNNGGTLTCAGVYNENYVFYASTCP